MILTLILIAVALASMASLLLAVTNHEAAQAAQAVYKRNGIVGVPMGCVAGISAVLLLGLWTWYAVSVSDWRFAAITWIPFTARYLGQLATKKGGSR